MHCHNCEDELHDDEVRWAFEEPYCEDCFDNMFNYCCRCDSVIYRESAHYNDDGDPYCADCYESDFDDDAPDNPDVSDSDRELVVKLSRSWLQGKVETRRSIFINDKDILLKTIKDKVGLVDNPIYVFGLVDRDEYQLSASSDLFDRVQSYVLLNDIKVTVLSSPGCNRLGISLSLRKNNQQQIIEMIKQITSVQELDTT
ncbi:MAG: hypothetical protein HND40_15990 [Ignavibacteriota bacterium]|nr:hypothetical protein [Ignavibacterium album]MCZ2267837.1 hypothetical protein [Ignavibacteriales bacterium]QKK00961.1 MAG: hypothetical protein HND40_15990 [Ignavibacteriota bacterium]HOJ07779.1 LIM domain-containing protein [Ignavibacteriaceae bacterium]